MERKRERKREKKRIKKKEEIVLLCVGFPSFSVQNKCMNELVSKPYLPIILGVNDLRLRVGGVKGVLK